MKKRILHVGEASFLKTGYATYANEVLSRLHATGKYEIAELGCFAHKNDPGTESVPWKFYANLPDRGQKDQEDFYASDQLHSFGSWRFEEVLLDFQPDIVWDIRDWWMLEFEERSPFREYYHWSIMPTVDAIPQHEQWISTFQNADSVFTYSDWALDVLKTYNGINVIQSAPPGSDIQTFRPASNKAEHKQKWGLPPDSFIIGTVMRNQKRKLYPDLMLAFANFLKKAPAEIAAKSYLYLHTSYPDWWNLPSFLTEYGIGHKCLFTYKCKECQGAFVAFFQDARGICHYCKSHEAFLPNTHVGISREELASIINTFDVYVQYANSEGFGMPQVEAASCGVPVMAIDYSAMSDVVRKLKGQPLKVKCLHAEADTGCFRAIPDNDDLVDKLISFAQLPESWKKKKGFDTRKAVENYYDWNKTAKIWENHFDAIEIKDRHATWASPAKIHQPNLGIPDNLNNTDFVQWILTHIAGRPELSNHYMGIRLLRDIQWQSTVEHLGGLHFNEMSAVGLRPKRRDFTRQDAVQEMMKLCNYKNFWENKRARHMNGAK